MTAHERDPENPAEKMRRYMEGDPNRRERDPDYSPAYQDEYQRLWHEAAAARDALAARVQELEAALRETARKFTLAEEDTRILAARADALQTRISSALDYLEDPDHAPPLESIRLAIRALYGLGVE